MSEKQNLPENSGKTGLAGLFAGKKQDRSQSDAVINGGTESQLDSSADNGNTDEPYQYSLDENAAQNAVSDADEKNMENSDEITVEKSEIHIDSQNGGNSESLSENGKNTSSPDSNNDTAVFTFAKDLPEGISHEELNLSELEDSAKSYFNATHTSSIDDKVDELCRLADNGFDDTGTALETPEIVSGNTESDADSGKAETKKKKRRRRKDVISNDDIAMLSGNHPSTDSADVADSESHDEYTDVFASGRLGENFNKQYDALFSDDEPECEYTDPHQETLIIKELRSNALKGVLSVILTIAAAIFCIYFESAAGTAKSHPGIFEPGRYGVVYALSMLQIMFFGIIFNLDGVKRAFKSLNPHKARPELLCAVTLCVCTLYTIISITLAGTSPSLRSYCSVGCLALVILSINSFIKSYTALTSFCIAASKKPKFSTTELDATSDEAGAFAKYLEQDTTIFTVSKNSFISGFFKKTFAAPKATKSCFKLAVTGIIVGVICGALSGFMTSDVYHGITVGVGVILASLPVNLLLATVLPYLIFSLRAAKSKTAFIGEAACDAYTEAGIISFDDTEVFPAKNVKVSSIRTYGDHRIDKVIIYMARIFDKLPGPLSYVFANSVQGSDEHIGEASVIEHSPDGLRIRLDDMEILLGTSNFFRLFDIATPSDNIDESFLQSLGSIMYMSVNGGLAAKFYIKYSVNRGFEPILHSLYNAGVCVGVKTFDPCINNQLICGNLKGTNYPVSVIRKSPETLSEEQETTSNGSIVSLTGVHSFLHGFISLDKLRNIYRSNTVVGTVCSVLSIIIAAALTLTGAVPVLTVSFFVGLQLLWCLPAIVFSFLSK